MFILLWLQDENGPNGQYMYVCLQAK